MSWQLQVAPCPLLCCGACILLHVVYVEGFNPVGRSTVSTALTHAPDGVGEHHVDAAGHRGDQHGCAHTDANRLPAICQVHLTPLLQSRQLPSLVHTTPAHDMHTHRGIVALCINCRIAMGAAGRGTFMRAASGLDSSAACGMLGSTAML